MIFNELNTGFRWYDALEKQTRFKEYCQTMCDFALMAPCNDLLPFQIKSDSFGQPIEWLLKYLDGTQLVPEITPAVDPAPLTWSIMDSSAAGSGVLEMYNGVSNKYYGVADWNTDLNTTMNDYVDSINNHIDRATPWIGTSDYTYNFTASWNSSTQVFTLTPPVGIGATLNGSPVQFAVNGGFWSGDWGDIQYWSGGVDAITNYVESDTIDITDCIPFLNQYELDGFNYLQYNGLDLLGCLPVQMDCGKWYSEITDGVNTVYSEVFEVMPIEDIAFEQMKLPLFTAWRFYDDIDKQNRNKEYCESLCNFYLISNNSSLLPFQIKTNEGTIGIESWKLISVDGDCEILLDTSLVSIVTTIDGDRIVYNGGAITNLVCGKFYSVLNDGVTTWYSELIEVIEISVAAEDYLQTDSGINLTTDGGDFLTID